MECCHEPYKQCVKVRNAKSGQGKSQRVEYKRKECWKDDGGDGVSCEPKCYENKVGGEKYDNCDCSFKWKVKTCTVMGAVIFVL